jgi:hypothetical protein
VHSEVATQRQIGTQLRLCWLLLVLLIIPTAAAGVAIDWDQTPDLVYETASDSLDGLRLVVSPGGTVFMVWADTNGLFNPVPAESIRACDGRRAFAFNARECPGYDSTEYVPNCGPLYPAAPCLQSRICPYYYLPYAMTSIYAMPRYPDGTWGPRETVSFTDSPR